MAIGFNVHAIDCMERKTTIVPLPICGIRRGAAGVSTKINHEALTRISFMNDKHASNNRFTKWRLFNKDIISPFPAKEHGERHRMTLSPNVGWFHDNPDVLSRRLRKLWDRELRWLLHLSQLLFRVHESPSKRSELVHVTGRGHGLIYSTTFRKRTNCLPIMWLLFVPEIRNVRWPKSNKEDGKFYCKKLSLARGDAFMANYRAMFLNIYWPPFLRYREVSFISDGSNSFFGIKKCLTFWIIVHF